MATATKTASTNGSKATKEEEWGSAPVVLHSLTMMSVEVPIVGVTPLIPHKWSEKSIAMMRDKHQGKKVTGPRENKNPEADAEAATYRLPDGTAGMPASAFKAAIVDACKLFGKDLPMTKAKLAIKVAGIGTDRLVPIVGPCQMHEDTPRNATGTVDLRYRNYFYPWSAVLPITVMSQLLDLSSLVNLVDAAGLGGVGDWRPSSPKSKTGEYGCFAVDRGVQIKSHVVGQDGDQ